VASKIGTVPLDRNSTMIIMRPGGAPLALLFLTGGAVGVRTGGVLPMQPS